MHSFPTDRDKKTFREILERHLSPREIRDRSRRPYRKLFDEVEVIAVNVLDNHYHLVILQKRPGGLYRLMKSILTAYGHYFNGEHGRRAQIFESPYSVRIAEDHDDVRGLIEYVHGQHEVLGLKYEFSSHIEYVGARRSDWISIEIGLRLYPSLGAYQRAAERKAFEMSQLRPEQRLLEPLPKRRALRRGRGSHVLPPPRFER
jgi:REP element-mobilizing transposase RayT